MKLFRQSTIVAAMLCSTSAFANPPAWTISESSGTVNVLRPGVTEVGTRGKALKAGDVIATGKVGRAVLVRGGEYLVISANSRIAIATPKDGSMTQIVQSFGNAVFKIQKKTTPHFAVQTPYLAAVVKGTTFSVTVEEGGASVQVTEGRVQVSTTDGGATHLVIPGEIGLVRSGMPGRLSVKGDQTMDIDSPTPPPAAPVSAPAPVVDIADAKDTDAKPAEETKTATAVIEEAIGEGAVDLAKVSGGMVSGNSTLVEKVTQTAMLDTKPIRDPQPKPDDVVPRDLPRPVETVEAVPPTESPPAPADVAPETLPPVPVDVAVVETPPCGCETGSTPDIVTLPAELDSLPAPEPVVDIIEVATNDVIAPPSLPKDDAPVNDVVDSDPTKNNGNGNGNDDKDKSNGKGNGNSNGNGNNDNSPKPATDTQDKPNRFVELVGWIRDELEERNNSNASKNRDDDDDDKPQDGKKPKPRRVN